MKKGVALLLAVLIGSLTIILGIGIFSLLSDEISLSGVARDSIVSLYAADSGVECALYFDQRFNPQDIYPAPADPADQNPFSIFNSASSPISCGESGIETYYKPDELDASAAGVGGPESCIEPSGSQGGCASQPPDPNTRGKSVFTMNLGNNSCAKVVMVRNYDYSFAIPTHIDTHLDAFGTSDVCGSGNTNIVQRSFVVQY